MKIQDILVGDNKVQIETEEKTYEFQKDATGTVQLPASTPQNFINELNQRDVEIEITETTVEQYAHDEATPYRRRELAEELGVPEDSDIVKAITGVTYEIKVEIDIREDGCYITHYDGNKLESPKKIY